MVRSRLFSNQYQFQQFVDPEISYIMYMSMVIPEMYSHSRVIIDIYPEYTLSVLEIRLFPVWDLFLGYMSGVEPGSASKRRKLVSALPEDIFVLYTYNCISKWILFIYIYI
jgi:hypothetical protein